MIHDGASSRTSGQVIVIVAVMMTLFAPSVPPCSNVGAGSDTDSDLRS
jgi:hypothetical protein